ncbi:phosphodiesterase [Aliagarivorans marinus]|uniref:phosphodiesterase n=1 Tax=Aliagarivorans marinus TaxID=561965 RepID=UPI000418B28A|nr:phosphodiesterase [Aliagarivorans marinus]
MLIAQLTDIHYGVSKKKQRDLGETRRLIACVDHINTFDEKIDLVVVSGDLAEDGWVEEYQALREILDRLKSPYVVIPGNHDRRQNLLAVFDDHDYLPARGENHVLFSIDHYPVRVIGLDTSLFGEPYGRLCEHRLAWLDKTLQEDTAKPTMIFMHHPPVRIGIDWVDSIGLYGSVEFADLLRKYSNIEAVCCGHVHRMVVSNISNIPVVCAPSIHCSISLSLSKNNSYSILYSDEPLSLFFHYIPSDGNLVSHLSLVNVNVIDLIGDSGELSERFKGEYRKLYPSGADR